MAPLVLAPARESRADPAPHANTREIQLQGSSETVYIALHPGIITVLYLPTEVLSAIISDTKLFGVEIKNERILIRPVVNLDPDVVANLHVSTEDIKLNAFITIAPTPEAATAQLVIRPPPPSPPKPSLISRLSLALGALLGCTFPELPGTAVKLGRSLLVGVELHLKLNDNSRGHELVLTVAQSSLDYIQHPMDDMSGPGQPEDDPLALHSFSQEFLLTRVDAGTSWRFGTDLAPFLFLRSGLQARIPVKAAKNIGIPGNPAVIKDGSVSGALDLFMLLGAGMDIRLVPDWRAGMHVSLNRIVLSTGGDSLALEGSLFLRWN